VAGRRRGGPRAQLTKLQLVGEAHGDGEGLRVDDLDVQAEGRLQTGGEELHLLDLRQGAGAGKQGLKSVLVLDDGARAAARHQLAERIGAQRRPKARMEQLREAPPLWRSLIALDLHKPQLGTRLQIVRCHPYLLRDALLVEVGLASVDEREGIGLAIEFGKIQLLETWRPVMVMLTSVRPAVSCQGRIGGALLEFIEPGLQGLDRGGQLGDQGRKVRGRQVSHR
jgi:hypothetical protein